MGCEGCGWEESGRWTVGINMRKEAYGRVYRLTLFFFSFFFDFEVCLGSEGRRDDGKVSVHALRVWFFFPGKFAKSEKGGWFHGSREQIKTERIERRVHGSRTHTHTHTKMERDFDMGAVGEFVDTLAKWNSNVRPLYSCSHAVVFCVCVSLMPSRSRGLAR